MAVSAAPPEGCLQCHVHEADAHLATGADCSVCHVPIARAERIPVERIALFPWPESHEAPDFLSGHAPGTPPELLSCAVCHARNSCERCHANAERLDAITALEHDERVAMLERGKEAEYPVPDSHLVPDWSWDHGATAFANPAGCTNCHTRPSCNECHLDGGQRAAEVIATLPDPVPGGARGVDLGAAGEGVHPWDFAERHASFAATGCSSAPSATASSTAPTATRERIRGSSTRTTSWSGMPSKSFRGARTASPVTARKPSAVTATRPPESPPRAG